jgi:DNA-binding NarL/FixJ family response regulator
MRNVTAFIDDPDKRGSVWRAAPSKRRQRLALVSADTLMRAALVELFRSEFEEVDCVEGKSLSEVVLHLDKTEDGWLVVHWPGDFSAELERLRNDFSPASWRIVVLSGETTIGLAQKWIAMGAEGVLADRLDAVEIVSAMRSILHGNQLIKVESKRDRNSFDLDRLPNAIIQLKPRSRTILDLLCDGRSTGEIAATLGISERTVKWHMTDLLSELNLSSRFRVVALVTRLRCSTRN